MMCDARQALRRNAGMVGLVPYLVGTILIGAAALKMPVLLGQAPAGSLSAAASVILIELEFILGAALVFSIQPRWTRLASALLFSGFLMVSVYNGVTGATSCACFGIFQSSPWLTGVMDIVLIVGLYFWKPVAKRPWVAGKVIPAIAGAGVICMIPAMFYFATPVNQAYPFLEGSQVTKLPVMTAGERREFALSFRNPHHSEIVVDSLEASCPCLEAKGLPWRFPPQMETRVTVDLDLSKEPAFSGSLLLQFAGMTNERLKALKGHVQLDVIDKTN